MEETASMSYTAASHQVTIETLLLQTLVFLELSCPSSLHKLLSDMTSGWNPLHPEKIRRDCGVRCTSERSHTLHGPVSEWLLAWIKWGGNSQRQHIKAPAWDQQTVFWSLWFVSSNTRFSNRGFVARAHTLALSACLHGVSSVLTSWESSLGFSGLFRCTLKWHKGPFMPESGPIHGDWVIAGRIHNCSASSISEVHWRKWRHSRLF